MKKVLPYLTLQKIIMRIVHFSYHYLMDKRPEDKAMQLTYSLGMVVAIVLCILIFFRLLYLFLS